MVSLTSQSRNAVIRFAGPVLNVIQNPFNAHVINSLRSRHWSFPNAILFNDQ